MKTWTVKSTVDPTKQYQVTMVTEWDWQCTCPDAQIRHHACKHVKGVQKAYDKQNPKSKPAPDERQAAEIQGDDRGHGEERDSVPSGELRGSDSIDGDSAGIYQGSEPDGDPGYSGSGEDAETSLGTPDAGADMPGPAEGGDQTPPPIDQRIRDADIERERVKAELKAREAHTYRKTSYSEKMWNLLQELRREAKAHPDRAETLKMRAIPIKLAIKLANQEYDKNEHQPALSEADAQFANEVESALF